MQNICKKLWSYCQGLILYLIFLFFLSSNPQISSYRNIFHINPIYVVTINAYDDDDIILIYWELLSELINGLEFMLSSSVVAFSRFQMTFFLFLHSMKVSMTFLFSAWKGFASRTGGSYNSNPYRLSALLLYFGTCCSSLGLKKL